MLKSLECNQLIESKLTFHESLNVLIGSDDGSNSIGKSSVLMLIDFAFGGDDFCKLCIDVIQNIGEIEVKIEYKFNEISYNFLRTTNEPNKVIWIKNGENFVINIDEFRAFLSENYNFQSTYPSFRSTVNPFFRIWGKGNYDPNRPLHSFPNEPYPKIRTNLLKLFGYYSLVDDLEKNKAKIESKKKTIQGMFNEGFVHKLSKKELVFKKKELDLLNEKLNKIKDEIEIYSLSVNEIVNTKNLNLKKDKNEFESKLFYKKSQLLRIENNLKFGGHANAKNFEKLSYFFPNVNQDKLLEIEKFHIGIAKILKDEMHNEKNKLIEDINYLNENIKDIDEKLKKNLNNSEKPIALVDILLELSIEEKKLKDSISYTELKTVVDSKVMDLKDNIDQRIIESLESLESTLNESMAYYVDNFYGENTVHPTIVFSEKNYKFNHNEDIGTGKSFANMIALDFSFFKHTDLPVLIHDLILFKNIEVHALGEILKTYKVFDKQSFIAIDEITKFDDEIIKLIQAQEFLILSSTRLAFNKSWKKSK